MALFPSTFWNFLSINEVPDGDRGCAEVSEVRSDHCRTYFTPRKGKGTADEKYAPRNDHSGIAMAIVLPAVAKTSSEETQCQRCWFNTSVLECLALQRRVIGGDDRLDSYAVAMTASLFRYPKP